jgi:hypothetical protein
VKLHGVQSARDAIGARVTVTAGARRWTRFLLAGDGYMASNERLLQFGLGEAVSVDRVEVAWPSGSQSVVQDIPINATLTLIEGRTFGALDLTGGSESTLISVGEYP